MVTSNRAYAVVVSGVFVGDDYGRPGLLGCLQGGAPPHGEHEHHETYRDCRGRVYLATVLALPVFAWEVSFAIWLIVKGFRPSTITAVRSPEVEGHTPLPLG
jgi:hypothetical protein